jgi:hypothetical protein
MSAFARELKVHVRVGPDSSEDSDNDNSSLQVLHSDSNIISYDSTRNELHHLLLSRRGDKHSTVRYFAAERKITYRCTKEGRNLFHSHTVKDNASTTEVSRPSSFNPLADIYNNNNDQQNRILFISHKH